MKKGLLVLIISLLILNTKAASLPINYLGNEPFVKEFSAYPNPTEGNLYVEFELLSTQRPAVIRVFNFIGQEMYEQKINEEAGSHKLLLDLSQLPKGIYMLEISDGKHAVMKRISVQ